MVLSEKELGLSDDHEGIILLPADAPVGQPLVDYLGDVVFEIKINPNMARAASILGVAREVAALTGAPLRPPSTEIEAKGPALKGQVEILIEEPGLNPRFTAALLRDSEIKPSPFWVQRRLKLAGMRPINNIVDVTNYVMLEIGQPLHAFDFDKLWARAGNRAPTIITRLAEPAEELETLDGVRRKLDPFTILVCDNRGPCRSAASWAARTLRWMRIRKNILLEAAAWDYINIRRTMQAQHIVSEAGYRFSRGVHPSQAIVGLRRAIEMMRELGGGQIARGLIDTYPNKPPRVVVNLPVAEVKRQLGVEIPEAEVVRLLERLDFTVVAPSRRGRRKQSAESSAPSGTLRVTVPDYRLDVDGTDDLIEEIARLYGYANLPNSRLDDELPPQQANVELEQEERVRDILVDIGLQDVTTYSLTTPEREALLVNPAGQPHEYVRIENPISAERTVMRQTLSAHLLELAASNLRYRSRIALFEVGRVYGKPAPGEPLLPREVETALPEDIGLPVERRRLGIVLTGPRDELSWTKTDTAPMDFFDLKGVLQALLGSMHIAAATYVPTEHPAFHPGRAALVRWDDRDAGMFGELHPNVRSQFDLPAQPVLLGEFDLDALLARAPASFAIRPLSRYPAVVQDLALIVDEGVPGHRVQELIQQTGGVLLQRAVLFDVYRGDPIPAGKKSLAFALTFQSADRTLSDADASKIRDKIVNRLRNEIAAELRGG